MSISTARNRSASHRRNHANRSNGDLKSLGDEAGNVLTHAAEQTAEQIKGIQSRVRNGIAVAKVGVTNAAKAVRKQAVRTDKVIRAKPYQSIAVASGLGLMTGYLLGRRRSNPS
jgi:ElaB/YqjD/DUF883 family membrane-anchored ribosome-binding protein